MVVEGVGGVMVPLSTDALVIDFMKMSGLSALVVSLPALGTINHTCLTLSALKGRGIPVAGVVFNRVGNPGGTFKRVQREIERISRVPVLGSLGSFKIIRGREASIVARARRALDLKRILTFFSR